MLNVQTSGDGQTLISGGLTKAYADMRELVNLAESAANKNDVRALHTYHQRMIGASIDLNNVSYFGLALAQIQAAEKQAKEPANDSDPADPADHHPV